uniref:Si:ch211-241f5.3 n=1 Tax=Salarias fasciatus TaxID=181472 RepID=A0A672IBJ5_SALFA
MLLYSVYIYQLNKCIFCQASHFPSCCFLILDFDECDMDDEEYFHPPCEEHAVCVNTVGSFVCPCAEGFRQSGQTPNLSAGSSAVCQDINECTERPDICGPHARCFNTVPGYSCFCDEGFISSTGVEVFRRGDGVTCRDINERQEENVCGPNATCVNTQGSYYCICNPGFQLKSGKLSFSGEHLMSSTIVMYPKLRLCYPDTLVIGFTTVALLSYSNLEESAGFFGELKPQNGSGFKINSKVVTVAVSNRNTSHLKEPVNITLNHLKQVNLCSFIFFFTDKSNPHLCVWDSSLDRGTWSPRGCRAVESTPKYTVCSCTHLSSFAVLMALYELEDKFDLDLITWIGLSLSLACLLVCILTFSMIRSIQSPRTTIHLHLCISLFIANFIFLTSISRTENRVGCAVVAGLLHYFFLASFCWMCLEGVQLFRMVILVFNTSFKTIYMMAGGYGVPAVIVAVSASVNHAEYGTPKHCWLSIDHGHIWSFYGPACAIITINIFFFLITVWKLAQKFASLNPDMDSLQKIKTFTITAVAQLCVLGTMWIFGCFMFEEKNVAVLYLFTVFGSLQGVLLFVMHCLFSKQVREEYGNILSRCCAPRKKTYSEFSQLSKANVSIFLFYKIHLHCIGE